MILARPREQTLRPHERVEGTLDLPARLRSSGHHAFLLPRFYGSYAPPENRLGGADGYARPPVGLASAARRTAHLLRDDLRSLGLVDAVTDSLPRCGGRPSATDLADPLGCLYVLEGATLCGQIVRPRAAGVTPARGCPFFAAYGDPVGNMWRKFGAAPEGHAAETPWAGRRVAASATFAAPDRRLAGGVA